MPSARFLSMPFESYVPDLINAADVVLGKVGYGFVSECLVHGTPLIFISRSCWPEEEYLVKLVSEYNAGFQMSAEDFASGSWGDALDRAVALRGSWQLRSELALESAAQVAVDIIKGVCLR